ncbi:MAG: hypothetical protein JWM47_4082, partial [Acidimicrobiales bacterium]|nr:hypothetical protein [Acidimicrobiales bacterium]
WLSPVYRAQLALVDGECKASAVLIDAAKLSLLSQTPTTEATVWG